MYTNVYMSKDIPAQVSCHCIDDAWACAEEALVQPAEEAHLLPQHFNSRICIGNAFDYPLWGPIEPQTEVMLLVDKVWSVVHRWSLVIPHARLTEQAFP